MKINAIVVDDEKNSRELLAALLKKHCPEVEVLGQASRAAEAYTMIQELKPDLVFPDIEMPVENGFDLLKKFESIPFSVIFVTSYDHYAIQAIRFSAIDYLLKPVEISELKKAIDKAASKKSEAGSYVVNLLHNIGDEKEEKKIPFHHNGAVRFVSTRQIIRIEADGTYSMVYCGQERFTSSRLLKDFEEFLQKDPYFIRINKSVLINVRHLKEYSKGDPFFITLTDDSTFECSRRRKPEVLDQLKKLSGQK